MINLILGANGSGKTQKLIEMANAELKKTDGLIVYIDRSDNHRREIDVQIRFLNAIEVGIDNRDKLCVEKLLEIMDIKSNDVEIYMTLNAEDVEGLDLTGINVINL